MSIERLINLQPTELQKTMNRTQAVVTIICDNNYGCNDENKIHIYLLTFHNTNNLPIELTITMNSGGYL